MFEMLALENILDKYSVLLLFFFAFIVNVINILIYKFTIDVNKVKEIKNNIQVLSKKAKEKMKSGEKEEYDKLTKEMMQLNSEYMRIMIRPMTLTFFPAIIIFAFLLNIYKDKSFSLPFALPFIGNSINWILFYVILTIALNFIIKKLFELEI